MKNITKCTNLEFKLEYWIRNTAICSLVSLIFFYILLALAYHEIRVKKSHQIGFLQLSIEKRYRVLPKYICISINIASLVPFVWTVSYWFVEGIARFHGSNQTVAETGCVVVAHVNNVGLTVGSGLVYLFLWLRQRVIYVHPSLKVLNSKYVSAFSFVVLILWILFWISLVTAYFIKVKYYFNKKSGCIVEEDSVKPYDEMVFIWTAVSIFIQILLLGLFIYPILKQARWRDHQNNPNLMRRVKKAIVFASICLGTDIAAVLVYLFFATDCVANSAIWGHGINLLINHLITIGCFDHWKKLLWPWNVKCCDAVCTESNSDEITPAASFSASQNQSQISTIA